MITLVLPLLNVVAMPDDDMEVGVEEEDDIRFEGTDVEMDRLGVGVVPSVLQQSRLDHH